MAPEPLLRRLVGAILRARREAQGRTLRDVAASARVSVAYLSEVERGRKEASSEVLIAVCGALGMRLVDLIADAHEHLDARTRVVDLTVRVSGPGITATGNADHGHHAVDVPVTLTTTATASQTTLLAA